jgi:GTP-binding protein
LKVLKANFAVSAARAGDIPHDGLLQVALAGRSNVGKSSLINALAHHRIARTSAAPGKTRLANFYRIELEGARGPGRTSLYLVDLPGYGYARGNAAAASELKAVAEDYLLGGGRSAVGARKNPEKTERRTPNAGPSTLRAAQGRPELGRGKSRASSRDERRHVLLLIDSRHPRLESDLAAARWLGSLPVTMHIVAAKIDKLTRSERARNLETIGETFGTAVLPVSAVSGEGLDDLWRMIASIGKDADRDE